MLSQAPKKLPYINLWGNGKPLREFIYCEDIADASVFLMNNEVKNNLPINVGSGEEISSLNLAKKISELTHCKGKIYWDFLVTVSVLIQGISVGAT